MSSQTTTKDVNAIDLWESVSPETRLEVVDRHMLENFSYISLRTVAEFLEMDYAELFDKVLATEELTTDELVKLGREPLDNTGFTYYVESVDIGGMYLSIIGAYVLLVLISMQN